MQIPEINEQQASRILQNKQQPYFKQYYAFYSSWLGGIIKNPHLMLLPIDDHLVHRGDGVFEAIKVMARSVYLLDEHLRRLMVSAEKISLKLAFNFAEMKEIILKTLQVAGKDDAMVRVYLSRGPGSFAADPYESVGSQFYVVITQFKPLPANRYEDGVVIGKSHTYTMPSHLAQAKSCNYLPNVLMKKEAVDRHLDFVIGIDAKGYITEGSIENVMIVDKEGIITHPKLDYILKGTTMTRACELARDNGYNTQIRDITLADLQSAREVMMAGTTLDILPVVEFEGQKISDGKPGPISKKLRELMVNDIAIGPSRTAF